MRGSDRINRIDKNILGSPSIIFYDGTYSHHFFSTYMSSKPLVFHLKTNPIGSAMEGEEQTSFKYFEMDLN